CSSPAALSSCMRRSWPMRPTPVGIRRQPALRADADPGRVDPLVRWPALDTPAVAEPRTGRQHALAVLQALFVTFLWSTSWVLIKIGLDDLDLAPLSFAGLRYALAALVLLPFGIRAVRSRGGDHVPVDTRLALRVAIYGLLFVAVAQGAQFAALAAL